MPLFAIFTTPLFFKADKNSGIQIMIGENKIYENMSSWEKRKKGMIKIYKNAIQTMSETF
jgi:hypothetical protein